MYTQESATLIRVWSEGGLAPAMREAASLIDSNLHGGHTIEHVYTSYDDQGWAVYIVTGALLPSAQYKAGVAQRHIRGRRVYTGPDPYDRPDGGVAGESQQEYFGIK